MGFGSNLGLALFLLSLFWEGTMSQSGCTNTLIGMAPCLNYVTGNSKTPSSSCCSSLENVVTSQPQCLCTALDGSTMAALGININKTIALALPGACHVNTPPVTRCGGGNNAPMLAPVSSPENSDGLSPTSIFLAGSKHILSNGQTSNIAFERKDMHKLLSGILVLVALFP
ncbi:hypothetical protein LXL04_028726 [Taraxacum kok-saghyz]